MISAPQHIALAAPALAAPALAAYALAAPALAAPALAAPSLAASALAAPALAAPALAAPALAASALAAPAPLVALLSQTSAPQTQTAIWDNACSVHLTNDLSMTYGCCKLPTPIAISGIGGKDKATHACQLKALPSTPQGMNKVLFSPSFPHSLFSLGQLQKYGGTYTTAANPNRIIIRSSPSGAIIDAPRLNHNNLLPVNFKNLHTDQLAYPSNYLKSNSDPKHHLNRYRALLSSLALTNPSTPPGLTQLPPSLSTSGGTLATFTREQILRATAARDLHYARLHPSDAALTLDLQLGKVQNSTVTPQDLALSRTIHGHCPDCIQGKATAPSRPTSQSAPATNTGEVLHYDPQPLTTTVLGGHTIKNMIVDEHSKLISQPGSLNKRPAVVFATIMKQIRESYNAHRHRVSKIMADPESVNKALQGSLGAVGIQAGYAYPNGHATRAERATRTVQEHSRAVAAGLAFDLPPETQLLLDQAVGESLNNSVNSDTYPLTPNQVVSGFLPKGGSIVEFGRCAMVLQYDDKRREFSTTHGIPQKQAPKAELGVSMGPIPGTDQTRWLLANGKVVPRKHIGSLLPREYVPFGWTPKPRVAYIPVLPPPVQELARPQQQPQPEVHNHNVQQPDADNTVAQSVPNTPAPPATMTPIIPPATQSPPTTSPSAPPPPSAPTLLPASPTTIQSSPSPAPTPVQPSTQSPTQQPRAPQELPAMPRTVQPSTPPAATPASPRTPLITAAPTLPSAAPRTPAPTAITSAPRAPVPAQQPSIAPSPAAAPLRSSTRTTYVPGQYATLNNRGRALFSLAHPVALVSRAHLLRKLAASRTASQREREHMLLYPPPKDLTNHITTILPSPPVRQKNEFGLIKALTVLPPPRVLAAVGKELHKIFDKFVAMKLIDKANIEKTAIYLRSLLIIKEKTNKDITARLAINGAGQPPSSYGATHAGTSDPVHRIFILASALADAAIRDKELVTASFDIEGAFLNGNPLPRSQTGGHQLLVRLPGELPRPYGGALAEISGTMYGLKQSNHIYDQDLIKTLRDAGYFSCPSHPYTFMKICPENPLDYLIVSFHVDDGDLVCTSNHLLPEFKDIITKRYGVTKFYEPSQGICGMRHTTNPDKSVTLDFGPYIDKMMTRIGMDKVPPALSPSRAGFFALPTTSAALAPLNPKAAAAFSQVNGELIYILPLRHDCRKEIVHLCRSPPIVDNLAKQFHLLRYLKHTSNLGLTFSSNKADFTNGVEISSASDAAQNVHPADSRSHSAYTL